MSVPSAVRAIARRCVPVLLVTALVAGVLSACASPSSNPQGAHAIAAGQFGGAFTDASVASTAAVLAQDGIATVADESAKQPVVPVHGSTLMRFTRAQVRAMALQVADHGGILGSSLDAATSTPSGDVPISYLLAAWVLKGTSAGAKSVRSVMGSQDWVDAPSIVFPVAALPLFVADVAGATPHTAANGPAAPGIQTAAFVSPNASRYTGVSGACSLISNFIQGVIDTVFNALTLTAPTGSGVGSTIGSFFADIWNEAVSLARQAIQGLASIVTEPIVSAIQSVSGAVAVIAEIASYLSPWSVTVTAQPSAVSPGDDGTFVGVVDSGSGGTDYPGSVSNCASEFRLTLPNLTAGGADATWTLGSALTAKDSTSVTLDKKGSSTIHFGTSAKDESGACGSADAAQGDSASGQLTVTRPAVGDLRNLANSMVTTGLGLAGSVAGPIVQAVLDPLLDAILAKIDGLTQVIGTGSVTITAPSSGGGDCSNQPSPEPSDKQAAACLVGAWRQTDEQTNGASRGGAGAIFTYRANGTGGVDYDGSAVIQSVPAGNPIQNEGSSTTSYTMTNSTGSSGTMVVHVLTSTATSTTLSDNHVLHLPSGVTSAENWTCSGNTATLTVSEGAGSTLTVDLERAGK